MNFPSVCIVIRSKNDAPLIGETLAGITAQEYPARIRRIHIDSGSTDGTCAMIERSNPDMFVKIRAEDYIPGQVLNNGMKLSSEDWVVFLNSDAAPQGRNWLVNLLGPALAASAAGKRIGAVFGRQIPRPDCEAVFAHDYERCFGPNRESAHWPDFFSMVNSAVNRAAWLEQAFREDLQYSEDMEWTQRLKRHGWEILYAEDSVAMHSHNYTFAQARKRSYGDSFAQAATAKEQPAEFGFVRSVLLAGTKDALRDFAYCIRTRRLAEWPRAIAIRYAMRTGRRRGFLDGFRHYGRD